LSKLYTYIMKWETCSTQTCYSSWWSGCHIGTTTLGKLCQVLIKSCDQDTSLNGSILPYISINARFYSHEYICKKLMCLNHTMFMVDIELIGSQDLKLLHKRYLYDFLWVKSKFQNIHWVQFY
jgi:hypothetical protein